MHTAPSRTADAAGLVVVMSVIAVDPKGWYAFVVLKWSAVAIAITIALWARVRDRYASPIPKRVAVLWGALIAVLVLAAIFGRDPLYAWTGTPERHLGVVTWCGFAASVFIGGALNTPAGRARFARWVAGATVFAGAYAVSELVGHPPLALQSTTDRVGGPYGSASLFGAALCVLVPVSFGAAVNRSESWPFRLVAWIGAALGTMAVVASGTRAAWVGLSIAVVVAASAALIGRGRMRFAAASMKPLLIAAAVAAAAIIVGGVVVKSNRADVTARAAGASSRLSEWEVGLGIVGAHPVLGVGPEGYRTALADGVSATYERTFGRSVLPDRAHNVLIDVAAAGGLLAAALYAAIAGFVLAAGWLVTRRAVAVGRALPRLEVGEATAHVRSDRADRGEPAPSAAQGGAQLGAVGTVAANERRDRSTPDPMIVGYAVAATAYLAQQWFLFPVATIDPIFWMVAGSVLVAAWGDTIETPVRQTTSDRRRRVLVAALFCAVIAGLGVNAVFAAAADRAARVGVERADLSAVQRAVRLRPDVVRYRLLESQLEAPSVAGRRAAVADLDRALEISPRDPIIVQARAGALLKVAIATGDRDDIEAARTTTRHLVADDPNCYRCALMLGYSEALADDGDAAQAAFNRAAELARDGDTEAQDNVEQLQRMETSTE